MQDLFESNSHGNRELIAWRGGPDAERGTEEQTGNNGYDDDVRPARGEQIAVGAASNTPTFATKSLREQSQVELMLRLSDRYR